MPPTRSRKGSSLLRAAAVGSLTLAALQVQKHVQPAFLQPAEQNAPPNPAHMVNGGLTERSSSTGLLPTRGLSAADNSHVARRVSNPNVQPEELDVPFELRGFSLTVPVVGLGALFVILGFVDYFTHAGGNGVGSLLFVYAIPIFTLGFALIYAELAPVPVETKKGAAGLIDAPSTPETLRKIKSDVTRHRYGDDAHLDTSLKALGLVGKGRYPQLMKLIEATNDKGEFVFTMQFQSREVGYNIWSDVSKLRAYDRFFGPGVWSKVEKVDKGQRILNLVLTCGKRPVEEAPKVQPAAAVAAA
eukprot:TRINITY_DN1525_c0_g2_i1.p1 TRINITY_DN1525_c0_g2~~TRINITY_DN1525_c0_g2_i1.p1  ORF type:complete len:335 (-),score=66.54 TRINITY_DN1525_c0_g2_i1:266-1171(-)